MFAGAPHGEAAARRPGIKVEKLNDRFRDLGRQIRRAALSKADFKKFDKADKEARKQESARRPAPRSTASVTSCWTSRATSAPPR